MSEQTWFGTLTRPVGHLCGTIAVSMLLLVCAVLAMIHPHWQPTLVVIGCVPLIIWSTVMAVIFHRATTQQPPEQG